MAEIERDCYHNDLTAIIEKRVTDRKQSKMFARRRYLRRHGQSGFSRRKLERSNTDWLTI